MRTLNVRQADIAREFYVTSEIEMVRSLNKLGHPTKMVAVGDQSSNKNPDVMLLTAPFGRSSLFRLKLFFLLPWLVLTRRIDVVVFDMFTVFTSILLLPLRYLGVCKLVLDIRSIPVEKSVSPRFVRMLKFAKAFFNGVAYITPGTRKYIEEKIGVKVPRTTIWTSAVNPASFSPSQTVPDANLAELTKDRFVLFYHGSISANRGVHHVLDALHQVVQQVPEILFVSLSDNNKFITEYCSKQGYDLSKHLLLLDAVENHLVPRYIKAADFCVVPLPRLVWWEVSSPLKLMEYLAMEKPVILTNIAAHTDVVPADADFCVYYDPDVPGDLARQIVHAAAQRANYQQRAYKGRSLIEAKFTWDHQAQKLVEFAQSA